MSNQTLRAQIRQLEDDKESILNELGVCSNTIYRLYLAGMGITEEEFDGMEHGDPVEAVQEYVTELKRAAKIVL